MEYDVVRFFRKLEIYNVSPKRKLIELKLPKLFSFNMAYKIDENYYSIVSKGLKKTFFEITKNGRDFGELEFHWNSKVTIRLRNRDGITKHFTLTKKHLEFKYELQDFLTNHYFDIKNKWSWSDFKFHFQIFKGKGFLEEDTNIDELELLAPTVFAVNTLIKRAAANGG